MFTGMMMSGRPVVNKSITISGDTENYNLITDGFGGVAPTARTIVALALNNNITVYSTATGTPAMALTGLPAGSVINFTNLGSVIGAGGDAGDGEDVDSEDEGFCSTIVSGGSVGGAGGNALECDGDVDLNITNASGEIFGGGGGGGGGGACERSVAPCQSGAGGGGGGGAGGITVGGAAGVGGDSTHFGSPVCTATSGSAGTGGSSGAAGSGGAGCGGSCTGGAGGSGGEYGAAGSVGGGSGKAGGAGSYSVKHDGIGSVTYVSGGSQGVDIKGTTD